MSILINESYANPTTPLWSTAGVGGGLSVISNDPTYSGGFYLTTPQSDYTYPEYINLSGYCQIGNSYLITITVQIGSITILDSTNPANLEICLTYGPQQETNATSLAGSTLYIGFDNSETLNTCGLVNISLPFVYATPTDAINLGFRTLDTQISGNYYIISSSIQFLSSNPTIVSSIFQQF